MLILTLTMCRHAVYSAFLPAQARKATWVERWHETCVCSLRGHPRRGGRQETWFHPAGQSWGWLQGARLLGKCRVLALDCLTIAHSLFSYVLPILLLPHNAWFIIFPFNTTQVGLSERNESDASLHRTQELVGETDSWASPESSVSRCLPSVIHRRWGSTEMGPLPSHEKSWWFGGAATGSVWMEPSVQVLRVARGEAGREEPCGWHYFYSPMSYSILFQILSFCTTPRFLFIVKSTCKEIRSTVLKKKQTKNPGSIHLPHHLFIFAPPFLYLSMCV